MKKYRFDDDSLNFVEDRKRVSRVLFSVVKYLVVSFVLFFSVYLFCSVAFDTDYQSDIKVENREISREYAEVSKKMELLDSVIYDIKARDAMIYVAMFNSEPVDQNNMNAIVNLLAPIHGDEPFRVFEDIEAACRGISGYTGRLESLYSRMSSKADSLRYIPSILPLKNMDSYQVSASVGMKMNPFYKQFARHEGIDILSAEGEEIIATADGVVTEARRSQGEDGNMIVIKNSTVNAKTAGILLENAHNLTIEKSTINHGYFGITQNGVNPGSAITLKDCNISGTYSGIYLSNYAGGTKNTLKVEGGKIVEPKTPLK